MSYLMRVSGIILLCLIGLGTIGCQFLPDSTISVSPSPTVTTAATPDKENEDQTTQCTPDNQIEIRWFVGLGIGTEPDQRRVSDELATQFNQRNQACIILLVEYVDNGTAPAILREKIENDALPTPDIIGPVGIAGRAFFDDDLLDLETLEAFDQFEQFDMPDYDSELVDLFGIADRGQVGIPFAVYPSFLYVNLDLFKIANLAPPPTNYSDSGKYVLDGQLRDWNVETLREVAMRLTLDENGNNATEDVFDPDIPQTFGYANQWSGDIRGSFSIFGGEQFWRGTIDAPQAVIPTRWRDAADWYYQAMWIDHFHPKRTQDALFERDGYWFGSGKVAMVQTHLWFVNRFDHDDFAWDIFAAPAAPDDNTTAKIHADTFSILEQSAHPDEAFFVLRYLLGHINLDDRDDSAINTAITELLMVYNGMPARISLQDAYLSQSPLANKNFEVARDSLAFRDIPNHEAMMPRPLESAQIMANFENKLNNVTDPDTFDVDAELDVMKNQLQALFDQPN